MEGTLRVEVSTLSTFKQVRSDIEIANLQWSLEARAECCESTGSLEHLSVYLFCNRHSVSTLWSCEANVLIKLLSQREGAAPFATKLVQKFNFSSRYWEMPKFIEWSELQKPENGYVTNDKASVEASVVVFNVRGIRLSPTFDFERPQGRASDGVLVIEGTRLHINKDYLAMHLPVFAAMFYGKFREQGLNEIPLKDVKLEQFTELLRVVYPSQKPVDVDNVEFLLMLGDKFEMKMVMDACETFLIEHWNFDVITKLVWAGQYQLVDLHDACMNSFHTIYEIKRLKKTKKYQELSDAIKISLLEKVFTIA